MAAGGHIAWTTSAGHCMRIRSVAYPTGASLIPEIRHVPGGIKAIGALQSELLLVQASGGLYGWRWIDEKSLGEIEAPLMHVEAPSVHVRGTSKAEGEDYQARLGQTGSTRGLIHELTMI